MITAFAMRFGKRLSLWPPRVSSGVFSALRRGVSGSRAVGERRSETWAPIGPTFHLFHEACGPSSSEGEQTVAPTRSLAGEAYLLRKDERSLFQIANEFALRLRRRAERQTTPQTSSIGCSGVLGDDRAQRPPSGQAGLRRATVTDSLVPRQDPSASSDPLSVLDDVPLSEDEERYAGAARRWSKTWGGVSLDVADLWEFSDCARHTAMRPSGPPSQEHAGAAVTSTGGYPGHDNAATGSLGAMRSRGGPRTRGRARSRPRIGSAPSSPQSATGPAALDEIQHILALGDLEHRLLEQSSTYSMHGDCSAITRYG